MLHGASADPVQAPPGHRLGLRQGAGRIIAPDDRRQVHGEITAAGRRRWAVVVAALGEVEDELFAGVDPALLRRLDADLRTLALALEGPLPD